MTTGAEIQIDDGNYTRIHYAILEELAKVRLSPPEFRALMFLLRQTYGWNKKEDMISLTQWVKATGDTRPVVNDTLRKLITKRIVYRRKEGLSFFYGFNKYVEQWDASVYFVDHERSKRFKKAQPSTPTGTSSYTGTSSIAATETSSSTATETSSTADTHNRQDKHSIDKVPVAPKAQREPTEHQVLFGAIAEVCKLDPKIKAKARTIGKKATELHDANYTAEDVRAFGEWWVSDRWRKEHTPVPKPADLLDKILQAKEWAARHNGHGQEETSDWRNDPQMVELRRQRGEA